MASNFIKAEFLKWSTGQINEIGVPCIPFISLYSTPLVYGEGGVELTVGGYTRILSSGKWTSPTILINIARVYNNVVIQFSPFSVDQTVSGWGLCDALTAGHVIWHGAFIGRVIKVGQIFRFNVGKLILVSGDE